MDASKFNKEISFPPTLIKLFLLAFKSPNDLLTNSKQHNCIKTYKTLFNKPIRARCAEFDTFMYFGLKQVH